MSNLNEYICILTHEIHDNLRNNTEKVNRLLDSGEIEEAYQLKGYYEAQIMILNKLSYLVRRDNNDLKGVI